MTGKEKDFLLAEFNKAWEQLFNIDNRRGIFARYFTILFVAVIGLIAKLFIDAGELSFILAISVSIILFFTISAGSTTIGVLRSEREANCRYRAKINYIRELLLKNTISEDVKSYINTDNEKIGIKLFTNVKQPTGDGGTLEGIIKLIEHEKLALKLLFVGIWIVYLASFLTSCSNGQKTVSFCSFLANFS